MYLANLITIVTAQSLTLAIATKVPDSQLTSNGARKGSLLQIYREIVYTTNRSVGYLDVVSFADRFRFNYFEFEDTNQPTMLIFDFFLF